MPAMVTVNCKCCGKQFQARVADRKRGWGKFCSKSCKAIKQEAKTGQYKEYLNQKKKKKQYDPNEPKPVNALAFGKEHDLAAMADDHSKGEDEMSWAESYYDKNS